MIRRRPAMIALLPTLPPGDYVPHWAVITVQGAEAIEGNIPFKVGDQAPR